MSPRMLPLWLLALALAGCSSARSNASGPIFDGAELLTPPQTTALQQRLAEIERRSSVQIAITTVPTLGDESIETVAARTFASLGPGEKGVNNGLLIVIAPSDQKLRIEVGTGLEWQISDSVAAIVVDLMLPHMTEGNYAAGISEALDALAPIATAVDWSIRYEGASTVARGGASAIGRIATLTGIVRALDETEAVLEVDGVRVEVLLPPHWHGTLFRLEVGTPATLVARVRSAAPLTVEALGIIS